MIGFIPQRDRKRAPPLTEQIVLAFEAAMASRRLRPGMAVPSVRAFARTYGVSTFTVATAYNRLVANGKFTARPGAGYRVAAAKRRPPEDVSPARWRPPSVGASWLLADVFADHSIPIKSGCGWLPPEWMNESGLRQALRHLARIPTTQLGGYGHPYGYRPLREQIAAVLADQGFHVAASELVLTQGASQALDIVVRTLLRPGDAVMVEYPGYANLLHALRMAGMEVFGVARGDDGLCMAQMAEFAQGGRIKALFVNTVLHNPTGTSLSMNNAFQLLQLAEQYNFWVVEDDVSRDLLPGAGPLLAAMAGTRRVVYVSGFSKSITPAMRSGYIASTPELAAEFAKTKMAAGLTTPEAMERAVHQVLTQGHHRSHLQRVQDRLRQAHDALTEQMDSHGFEVLSRPRAGLFLWARPPGGAAVNAIELAQKALDHGIWLAPGAYFFPDAGLQDAGECAWIRFNVAYSLHPELWSFMRAHADK